ncbi:MAG: DinB family protein [Planctomycetaceae bacterium]|nr:DinB family protein [Planctomycetaceae bacterium]
MNSCKALQLGLDMAEMISLAYINDLTDEQLMLRPCSGTNHIKWQIGHLIASEHSMIEGIKAGTMPPLPDGFAARYEKATAESDDASAFDSKEVLLATYQAQRAATIALLNEQNDEDLDRATGVDYAPTVGNMFSLQGSHWLMHAGQWVIVRRQLGLPALF